MADKRIEEQINLLKSSETLPPLPPAEKSPFEGFNPQVIPPKLPDAPNLDTEPTGRMKALRAALIVAAGAAGGGDAAAALALRFRQEDSDLSRQIQQDFANRMAVAQEEGQNLRTQVSSAESDRQAGLQKRQLDLTEQGQADARNREVFDRRQAVLNGMLMAAELDLRQKAAAGQDTAREMRKYEMLGQLRNSLNDQLRAVQPPDKKVSTLEVMGLAQSLAAEAQKSGNKKATAQQFMGQAQEQILGMRERAYVEKLSQVRKNYVDSPAFKMIRDSYSDTPLLQNYMDLMFQSVPGPGNPNGDPVAFETGIQGLMHSDPDAFGKIRDATVKTWVAEGRYPDENTAMLAFQDFANSSKESSLWDLPPTGSFNQNKIPGGFLGGKFAATYLQSGEFKGAHRGLFQTEAETEAMLKKARDSAVEVKATAGKVKDRALKSAMSSKLNAEVMNKDAIYPRKRK